MPLNWYSLTMKIATRVNLQLAAFALRLLRRVEVGFLGSHQVWEPQDGGVETSHQCERDVFWSRVSTVFPSLVAAAATLSGAYSVAY